MAKSSDQSTSEVGDWYKTKNVFITGATGFLGQTLIERIATVTPAYKIYLLLRSKDGKNIKERLEAVLKSPIFDRLRNTNSEWLANISAIEGDIFEDELGLSEPDQQTLIKDCNVVFHCAANVKFNQTLKCAVMTNTLGTKRTLQLAKQMNNLDAFIHVSTAYCQVSKVLEEISYPAPHDPDKIVDMVSWMDQDILTTITPKLLGKLPNTYAYSKALSEQLVADYGKLFPIGLTRPSMVSPAWKNPIPGWTDNMNGPTGISVGIGRGAIRSIYCKENYLADIVPVDICANALIALAWRIGITRPSEVYICNITESGNNPITWGETLNAATKYRYEYAFVENMWYSGCVLQSSLMLHKLYVILFHLIPAYVIDALLSLIGREPILVKIQKRISFILKQIAYYATKEWIFKNDNFMKIDQWLSPHDRNILYIDNSSLNWENYLRLNLLGGCIR
ncbi:putative fatty acyl-CoA reductase CG5065 [Arctopsyche grandis]|uniref:putative fatty acyl-CoA reductase CG5065 n=1 Tax=Arctopsyche grandis TaxID=121162 RepID=UPI00406D71C9